VATKKVENVVSTHMVVAYEVVDSSNVTVDIVGVFPFVGNCAWVVDSSKFKVLFSTDEMKSLAAVVSQYVVLTSSIVVVVSVSLKLFLEVIAWSVAMVV
jgi:hypothetical protein